MRKTIKRLFDITAALLGLIFLSPLLLILPGLIAWKLGWPVFFTRECPGWRGMPFRTIKFRTMTNARDSQGKLLPNKQRQSKFGNFLRSTSLDELPELIESNHNWCKLLWQLPVKQGLKHLLEPYLHKQN